MTSSLVGSEMCIRDSVRDGTTLSVKSSSVVSAMLEVLPQHPGSLAPVSYTHLTLPTICSV
eukprot:10171641-Prorocentrum_lima.AAC.1